ncbi:unnamed protein product, partial [Nesidiocoris tenuis]
RTDIDGWADVQDVVAAAAHVAVGRPRYAAFATARAQFVIGDSDVDRISTGAFVFLEPNWDNVVVFVSIYTSIHYDTKDVGAYNTYLIDYLFTVESAKWKWRGLRDSFRIHLRKSISAEKQGALQPVTWIYYEEMAFLKDQIYVDVNRRRYWPEGSVNETAIKRYGNLSSSEEDDGTGVEGFRRKKSKPSTTDSTRSSRLSSSTNEDNDRNSENVEIIIKEEVGNDFCSPAEVCAIEETRRLEPDSAKDNFEFTLHRSTDEDESFSKSSIIYKKFKALQDDNYCFLKSVLPQMKALPAEKNFQSEVPIFGTQAYLLMNQHLPMEDHGRCQQGNRHDRELGPYEPDPYRHQTLRGTRERKNARCRIADADISASSVGLLKETFQIIGVLQQKEELFFLDGFFEEISSL